MKMMKISRFLLILCGVMSFSAVPELAAEAGTLYESAYVRLSPDGYAWTTQESLPYTDNYRNYLLSGQYPEYWYMQGSILDTGTESTLRDLREGEHYYGYDRMGETPVGYWQVAWSHGRCIHDCTADMWHGVPNNSEACHNAYYSGWFAYCADCGGRITSALVYMSKEAAASITSLDVRLGYYYQCPANGHVEVTGDAGTHDCKAISFNKYSVTYERNGDFVNGEMNASYHMYNNENRYRGEPVTPITRLTKNAYIREGYTFAGWNTEPDGSGKSYADGDTIFNLSVYNVEDDPQRGTVTLYAQWKETESILRIDPAGGSFGGKRGITEIVQGYGTAYFVGTRKVAAPDGYTVSFDADGGTALEPIKAAMLFCGWKMSQPFHGYFGDNTYYFEGETGDIDTLTANYNTIPIILPTPHKPGYSFGGWSEDKEGKKPVGFGGDEYVPKKDVTLYANWVELVLCSYDNYTDNGGKGAVNLKWTQPDERKKAYKLYRSGNGSNFVLLYGADEDIGERVTKQGFSYKSIPEVYTIPYGGFYTLTAGGAQGGAYGGNKGGAGGGVTARFYLKEGERLTVTVGGQGGYNGGGYAERFGSGGGATTISSNLKGCLLIAGGGGGASPFGRGGDGGMSTSLRADKKGSGAAGQAGGGAGYVGGNGGEEIIHSHVSDCFHVHTGNTCLGGGCYGNRQVIVKECGGDRKYFYTSDYDATNMNGVQLAVCPRCGSPAPCWHHDVVYKCDRCKTTGLDGGSCSSSIDSIEYSLSCSYSHYASGQQVQGNTICGYKQEQVLSAKPAYGGSSYVNESYAISFRFNAGDRLGNGMAIVEANTVGYIDAHTLNGVAAPDLAAPDAVSADSVRFKPLSTEVIQVSFDRPKDNGTQYWWKAESYKEGTEALLCTSNITTNTLTTGTAGYYYILDTIPTHGSRFVTAANARNRGDILTTNALVCNTHHALQYLHIAAVDMAGNVGVTTDIRIDRADQRWSVATDKIQISDVIGGKACKTVYPDGKGSYYVRADGEGSFSLSFHSNLGGEARDDYQVNLQIFDSRITKLDRQQRYITQLPHSVPLSSEEGLPVTEFVRQVKGTKILADAMNTGAYRTNNAKDNNFYQTFTIPASLSGETIVVTPVAGIAYEKDIYYSDWERDVKNAIILIADGEAPIVHGTKQLEDLTLIDRESTPVYLDLYAEDNLSGVKDFEVSIYNMDNYMKKTYTPDADGHIYINLTEELPVFSGTFVVNIRAVDQVGNIRELSYGATEFSLSASVSRILEPHEPLFKGGESGLLHITTWGYADYVEVEFPEEMLALNPDLNKTYYYNLDSLFKQEEELQFMIPLYTPPNEKYTITVRAYKGEAKLEEHPALGTISVEGSIIDELRTRLR